MRLNHNWVGRMLVLFAVALAMLVTAPAPASAKIGPWHWQYGTIYVQNVTPTHAWSAKVQNRVLYYHNLGAHWDVRWGHCVTGLPCIRLAIAAYGNTGWAGLTDWADTCADAATWCNFRGNINDSRYMTKVFINTSGGEQTDAQILGVACHELGHALADLEHVSNTGTCMQTNVYSNPTSSWLTETEKNEIRGRFSWILLAP